jgi:hypothetical protein
VQSRLYLYAVYGLSDAGIRLRQRRYYKPDEYGPRLTQAPGYLKVVGGGPAQEGIDVQVPASGATPDGEAPRPVEAPERADELPATKGSVPPAAKPAPPADAGR